MVKFSVIGGDSSADLAKRIARRLKAVYVKTENREFPDGESKITIERNRVSRKIEFGEK